jgi:hypothetical protein
VRQRALRATSTHATHAHRLRPTRHRPTVALCSFIDGRVPVLIEPIAKLGREPRIGQGDGVDSRIPTIPPRVERRSV